MTAALDSAPKSRVSGGHVLARSSCSADLQGFLFDIPRPEKPAPQFDVSGLQDKAFLYTGSEKGNYSGIRFGMSVEEAQKWCGSDVSRGTLHGTQWAYFWTTAANFLSAYPPPLDLEKHIDNGTWDDRIAAMGLTKVSLWEFEAWLAPHGVEVINSPSRIISEIMKQNGDYPTAVRVSETPDPVSGSES